VPCIYCEGTRSFQCGVFPDPYTCNFILHNRTFPQLYRQNTWPSTARNTIGWNKSRQHLQQIFIISTLYTSAACGSLTQESGSRWSQRWENDDFQKDTKIFLCLNLSESISPTSRENVVIDVGSFLFLVKQKFAFFFASFQLCGSKRIPPLSLRKTLWLQPGKRVHKTRRKCTEFFGWSIGRFFFGWNFNWTYIGAH